VDAEALDPVEGSAAEGLADSKVTAVLARDLAVAVADSKALVLGLVAAVEDNTAVEPDLAVEDSKGLVAAAVGHKDLEPGPDADN
jgi:hypothetical protein